MLKFPCLVLDHDDTVVQSEATVNYPFFTYILNEFRPGAAITLEEYVGGCCSLGFVEMCRRWYDFTDAELEEEYRGWKEYIRHHIPAPYPGIDRVIRRQKEEGGIICVVSMSSEENIRRDYQAHFGLEPDDIFGWDLEPEHRKPSPYALDRIMEKYHLSTQQLLVVDDMKPAWQMARAAVVPMAFAAWSRLDYPEILTEMESICDYSFRSPKDLEDFLFADAESPVLFP
ncbi:MAG: HAD family hydrolase [Faecousia sp.]